LDRALDFGRRSGIGGAPLLGGAQQAGKTAVVERGRAVCLRVRAQRDVDMRLAGEMRLLAFLEPDFAGRARSRW